jgi:uncharacterized protein (DUF1800 family)
MPTPDLALRVLAGTTYAPNPYVRTAVPTADERLMLNRLGCGWSRATWLQMRAQGGAQAWFERQLSPDSVPESAKATSLSSWFPRLADGPAARYSRHQAKTYQAWQYARDHGNWTTLRRMYSERQLLETMSDFWNNHLHVPLNVNQSFALRGDYDQTIRTHALGRFEDLLLATSLHPAMLVYLDNWKSVRNAPNENQGRELLELHTVGRTSGYTEQMVKDSAKILSGWTVGVDGSWQAYYDTAKHTTGTVQVLGFTDPNTAADGAEMSRRYLRYLANHPATARVVARRLAVRFVSDTPSDALVAHLADVFTASGTDISATLRALVATDEFARSAGKKVRTPVDDLVATCRALDVQALAPTGLASFANAIAWMPRTLLLYQWPRPDGAPETNADWCSVSRMLSSFRFHWSLAGGYYPTNAVKYRPPASWLPQSRIRADQYIDHLCRVLLGRPSTALDVKAVCQATGRTPTEYVTIDHPLARYLFVRMAAALLDSPDHLSR